ncbi:MAG: COX15/CtaA family protein [Planctomycetota bacterium]|nr:COX15/CtaA family protein [Planctomycetota bacterium]
MMNVSASSAPLPTPRWVHRFACVLAGLTFVLIVFGGTVKSLEAGLSVPDWPLSYGQPGAAIAGGLLLATLALALGWLFTKKKLFAILAILAGSALAGTYYLFGPPGWYTIQSVRAEHSHRLLAGTVGFLTAILAACVWETDRRRGVRRLALAALLAVIVQAVLGGLTVRYGLPPWVSAAHGALAQAFFAMVCALAALSSPNWFGAEPLPQEPAQAGRKPLYKLGGWMVGAIYLQIMLGTAVRHSPYDPEASGNALFWWHFAAHAAGFLFVAHTVAKAVVQTLKRHGERPRLTRPALSVAGLLVVQVGLGVGILVFRLLAPAHYEANAPKEIVATAHVAVGGLALVGALFFTLRAWRLLPPDAARAGAAVPLAARSAS